MSDTQTITTDGGKATTKLATLTTLGNDAAIPSERVAVLDGVQSHGEPVVVLLSEKRHRADVLATGKKGQTYVARTPRPSDVAHPKLVVNGVTKKNSKYERGFFPPFKDAPNVAPRSIATAKLTDPTVTLLDGTVETLPGTWHIVSMVKTLDNGRMLKVVHVVKSDDVPLIPCVNA